MTGAACKVMQYRVAVLMTCHNRKDATIQTLRSLKNQKGLRASVEIFLVDDGSRDGTGEAVVQAFPDVHLLQGSGNLYWCGGMRMAFKRAMEGNHDFYLWLNDDTVLYPGALQQLVSTYCAASAVDGGALIVVGSTQDPETGAFTYGGWIKRQGRWGTPTWEKQPPASGTTKFGSTFNGNCVLIPRDVAARVGNLDPAFTHIMGDLDYGLRAASSGCTIVLAPGYAGVCKANTGKGDWTDRELSVRQRWTALLGPKGLPVGEWLVFCRRHKGRLWPLVWLSPYILFWLQALRVTGKNT
jgi:GT2 family glycosyltransferase